MIEFFSVAMLGVPLTGVADLLSTMGQPWAVRALISSLLIGLTCGVIGCFIVLRNMSLIGDALSHSILPGIFLSFLIFGYSTIGFFAGSVVAGIVTAVAITWIQQNLSTKSDAAIGIVFTVMFSIGVIGISYLSGQGGVHLDLQDFLFGDVLGVGSEDLILTALVAVYCVASVALFYRYLFITTFQPTIAQTMGISVSAIHYFLMLMLSFAVVAALRSVGVILVVAMLITPASTALLLNDELRRVLVIAGVLGMLSALLGMVAAIIFDMPPGPAMVIVATLIYFMAAFFAPQKGILIRSYRSRQQRLKIEREDILRQGIKHKAKPSFSRQVLTDNLGYTDSKINKRLKEMTADNMVSVVGDQISLTAKGRMAADRLVRAHRLWESYQVGQMGLGEGQIHDEADRLEHHLTEEILDEVDRKLGYPETDPHGSPIPKKSLTIKGSLLGQKLNQRVYIKGEQASELIESELWELGLVHGTAVTIRAVQNEQVVVSQGSKRVTIPATLARKVEVFKKSPKV